MPARYDRFGNAIPFPSGVDHGSGGGLEYKCKVAQGCEPVSQKAGKWVPNSNLKLAKGSKIVAIREDGGLARMDPIHHGWAYASYWVKTDQCTKTKDPKDVLKPESQHVSRIQAQEKFDCI